LISYHLDVREETEVSTTTTRPALPKGLEVSVSDIEHGSHAITATAYVSWPRGDRQEGGPLTLAFWSDTLVMYTPSGSGSYHNLRFYLRGAPYNVRAEFERQPDGTWALKPGHYDRSDWVRVSDMTASSAARRDLSAILAEVGRHVVESFPDLFADAERARLRSNVEAAQATVDRLEKELGEARLALRTAEAATWRDGRTTG
jgi:hypothetical protein